MKKIVSLLFLLSPLVVLAQTMLNPGDIVMVGFNSTLNIDQVYFIPLVDLEQGTEFYITDNGYDGEDGDLFTSGSGEDFVLIKTNQVISKGTLLVLRNINDTSDELDVSAVEGGDKYVKSISKDGDQILIFQGSIDDPHFIFAVSNRNADWDEDPKNAGSRLPPNLKDGETALKLPHVDNYALKSTIDLSATNRADWIERIADINNWDSSDETELLPPAGPFAFSGIQSEENKETGNWEDKTTWTNDIPSDETNVSITDGTVTINCHATVNNLTISDKASVIVSSESTLTVNGVLTNNAGTSGLILKSDANGTAFLYHNTDNIDATVERFLSTGDWHYCTVPLKGSHNVEDWFTGMYVIRFTEKTNSWDYLNTGDVIAPMEAVAVWPKENTVISYKGTLNNTDIELLLKLDGSGDMKGYSLVGNPFVCPVAWEETGIERKNCNNSIHVWDGTADNYKGYNQEGAINGGSKFLAPSQGFFVKANDSDASLKLGKQARRNTYVDFKSGAVKPTMLFKLRVSGDTYQDEIIIRLKEQENAIDLNEWGLTKIIPDNCNAPQLFIDDQESPYSIKTYASTDSLKDIKLTLQCSIDQKLKIEMVQFLHPDSLTPVILRERDSDKQIDLRNTYMEFDATADTPIKLSLSVKPTNSSVKLVENNIRCYRNLNEIVFSNISSEIDRIKIINEMGQVVLTKTVSNTEMGIDIPFRGCFIALFEESGKVIQKIKFIN